MKLILKSLLIAVILTLMCFGLITLILHSFKPVLPPFIFSERSMGVEYSDNRPTEPETIKLVPPPLDE